jgi:FkbM family methyltransferase
MKLPGIITIPDSKIKLVKTGDAFIYDAFFLGIKAKKDYYTIEVLETIITKCKCYWDIGADQGVDSIFPAIKNTNCITYAFEPIPRSFENLKKNIELNNIKSVLPFPIAISDKDGNHPFYIDAENSVASGLVKRDGVAEILVQTSKIDTLIIDKGLQIPELVKIDVEGYEPQVLLGMQETLKKEPVFIVEVLTEAAGLAIQKFFPSGYKFFAIDDERSLLIQKKDIKRLNRISVNYLLIPDEKLSLINELKILKDA